MADVYDVLQHFQLWTIFQIVTLLEILRGFNGSNLLRLLVCQGHLFVDRQSAELTQQHLRQRQSVIDLHHCHFSLIDFHADAQTLRTGCHALAYHLLYVTVQFLYQVKESFSQLLLMA